MQDDKNPEKVISKKRGPKGSVKLDLQRYLMDQYRDSFSNLNIHATCVECNCTMEYALSHPELLLNHYNCNGGTANYEKYRSRYEKLCDYSETCPHSEDCELALVQTDFEKCPLWKMNRNGCDDCKLPHTTLPRNIIFPEGFACAI